MTPEFKEKSNIDKGIQEKTRTPITLAPLDMLVSYWNGKERMKRHIGRNKHILWK